MWGSRPQRFIVCHFRWHGFISVFIYYNDYNCHIHQAKRKLSVKHVINIEHHLDMVHIDNWHYIISAWNWSIECRQCSIELCFSAFGSRWFRWFPINSLILIMILIERLINPIATLQLIKSVKLRKQFAWNCSKPIYRLFIANASLSYFKWKMHFFPPTTAIHHPLQRLVSGASFYGIFLFMFCCVTCLLWRPYIDLSRSGNKICTASALHWYVVCQFAWVI